MSDSSFGRCIECGVPLPPKGVKTGRERRYCSDACRKRASRQRSYEEWARSPASAAARLPVSDKAGAARLIDSVFTGSAEDRAAEILLVCSALSVALLTVAPELPAAGRCRFEKLGTLLRDELAAEFPQVFTK